MKYSQLEIDMAKFLARSFPCLLGIYRHRFRVNKAIPKLLLREMRAMRLEMEGKLGQPSGAEGKAGQAERGARSSEA